MEIDKAAYEAALSFLRVRMRTTADVRQNLLSRGVSEPLIEPVLNRLAAQGILNDAAFAEAAVKRAEGRKAIGRNKLAAQLEKERLDDAVLDKTLAEFTDEKEQSAIEILLQCRNYKATERAKAARFLLSRGFDADNIECVLDRFFGEVEFQG